MRPGAGRSPQKSFNRRIGQVHEVMRRQYQAEVIDAGRRHWRRRLSLRHLAVHMPSEDEWDRLASWITFPIDVHPRQVVRIEAQLDSASGDRLVDEVAIAGQRDRGGLRHTPHECFTRQRWLDGVEWAVAPEAFDWRLGGLGVLTHVAHLLGPRHSGIIDLLETRASRCSHVARWPGRPLYPLPTGVSVSSRTVHPCLLLAMQHVHARHLDGVAGCGCAVAL
jgi:hypothetical protein